MADNQAEHISGVMLEAMERFSESLAQHMQELNNSLLESAKQIKDAASQVENMLTTMKASAEETGNVLNQQLLENKTYLNEMSKTLRQLGADFVQHSQYAGEQVEQITQNITQAGETFTQSLDKGLPMVANHMESIGEVLTEQRTLLSEFNDVIEEFNTILENFDPNEFTEFTQSLQDLAEQQKATQMLVDKQQKTMAIQIQEFKESLEYQREMLRSQAQEIKNSIEKQTQGFNSSLNNQREMMQGLLADNVKDLGGSLEKMHETLRKNISQADMTFSGALDILATTVQGYGEHQQSINQEWKKQLNECKQIIEKIHALNHRK